MPSFSPEDDFGPISESSVPEVVDIDTSIPDEEQTEPGYLQSAPEEFKEHGHDEFQETLDKTKIDDRYWIYQ